LPLVVLATGWTQQIWRIWRRLKSTEGPLQGNVRICFKELGEGFTYPHTHIFLIYNQRINMLFCWCLEAETFNFWVCMPLYWFHGEGYFQSQDSAIFYRCYIFIFSLLFGPSLLLDWFGFAFFFVVDGISCMISGLSIPMLTFYFLGFCEGWWSFPLFRPLALLSFVPL